MNNRFRKSLLERKPTFGAWLQVGHAAVAEVFGRLQFDWIAVDLEHGGIDLESMTHIFRAIERFGSAPVARLPFNDPIWIKRVLDAGAEGLIIPMVNSRGDAQSAVREAKYPPLGRRGYGYSRANLHGIDFADYIRRANDEIAVVMQIEHREGIGDLEGILDVEGVDGAFIGPLDLSGSFGKTGQLDCPEMLVALSKFRALCAERRVSAGMHLVHPDTQNIEQALRDGYTMIALGVDLALLSQAGSTALQTARAAVASGSSASAS
jgi:2-dehydro-3-deoxyglucarate aldolase